MGAFEAGADPDADRAVALQPALNAFLQQAPDAPDTSDAADRLAQLLGS